MAAPDVKTLYLIDGHALAYRTYFALTKSGFRGTSRIIMASTAPIVVTKKSEGLDFWSATKGHVGLMLTEELWSLVSAGAGSQVTFTGKRCIIISKQDESVDSVQSITVSYNGSGDYVVSSTNLDGSAGETAHFHCEHTAGVFGFTSVLLRMLEQESPDYLAVSFDVGKTFRDDMFPDYKATREKMSDDLRAQIERIHEVVSAFNIPVFTQEGYEADDVLGSLSRLAARAGVRVVIVTGDRDLLQLVTEQVSVSLPGRSLADAQLYGPRDVAHKYGVTPSQFVDYKALVGDKSDNIPGVAGVGEKTAKSLLRKYLTLDNIYAHLDEVMPRFEKKLAADKENAYLSRKLAAIVTDLQLDFDLEACAVPAEGNFDRAAVEEVFRELEFRTLLKRLSALGDPQAASGGPGDRQLGLFAAPAEKEHAEAAPEPAPTRTVVVDNAVALQELAEKLSAARVIAFDTETTSIDPMSAELVGLSFAVAAGEGYYVPVGHQPEMAPGGQLRWEQVRAALAGALTDADIKKVAHNAKYDFIVMQRNGLTVAPLSVDTMVAEWLCDPGSRNKGLKNLAKARLGVEMEEIATLIGTGKKQKSMAVVPVESAAPYAAADADMTLRLLPLLWAELEHSATLELLQLEMELIPVLAQMEMNGVLLDSQFLAEFSVELEQQVKSLNDAVMQAVGYEFNLKSTQLLSIALFEHMGIDPPRGTRRTASGHYSTAVGVLKDLAAEHTVVGDILQYRKLAKLKSTYVDALPLAVNEETGRVHTSFNQTGTVTGRLSSSEPNLQNIPIRTEVGRRVRRAFVAPSGCKLVAMDYSQIELRIAAHISEDEFLLRAFERDEDIHMATAAAVFNVAPAKVTSDQRRQAKAVNFGLLYGMGPYRLMDSTGITLGEAEEFIETYFARLPGVKRYLDTTREQAQRDGYVQTLQGRRRYFPLLRMAESGDQNARARAEREAINAPIQGTAADIIKLAMVDIGRQLSTRLADARLLLQVHDELLFECPDGEVQALVELARPIMETAFELAVPLKVDVSVGQNWEQMQALSPA